MHSDVVRFHRVHGTCVSLSHDATTASRSGEHGDAIIFSAHPLRRGQHVCIELTRSKILSVGALRIGVAAVDPGGVAPSELPRYACPVLTCRAGYWARALNDRQACTGMRVTVWLEEGEMYCNIGSGPGGLWISGLPSTPLWLMLDVYGNTRTARLLPSEEVPIEIIARGPDALNTYQVACQSGTKGVFRTRLMLVGQDGAGKTSLKKALTGQRHDTAEESTDGIDLSTSCTISGSDHSWRLAAEVSTEVNLEVIDIADAENDLKSLQKEAYEMVACNIVQELLYRSRRQHSADEPPPSRGDSGRQGSRRTVIGRQRSSAKDKRTRFEVGSAVTRWQQELLLDQPEEVGRLVEKMWRECNRSGSVTATDGDTSQCLHASVPSLHLNIWDFAGHAAYYTTHQIFLSSRAVYVIVFNLCDDLDLSSQSDGNLSNETELELADGELSNLGYIDYWLNTIHSQTSQNGRRADDSSLFSPPVFIVGTHLSSVHHDPQVSQQMVAAQFERIQRFCEGKPYQRQIVPTFYAVENNTDEQCDDNQIDELRKHIGQVASQEHYMGEQIPIKWMYFEQALADLAQQGTDFSSLDQISEVAKMSGIMSNDEFSTTLQFYHDLGMIVCHGGQHDSTLRNTVILRPQWLVNMFKRVICTRKQLYDQDWERDLWHSLETTGVLEEKLVNLIWKDVPDQKVALLGLMEKYDLICCRRDPQLMSIQLMERTQKSYYVPSRLNKCPLSSNFIPNSVADVVFYLDFNGFLPDGLFQRLVTRAVRWSQECGGHEPCLAFRHARFFLNSEHDFVLQMAPLHMARIKVTIVRVMELSDCSSESSADHSLPPPKPEACAKVRHFVESSLTDLRELWLKRICYTARVQCHCERLCVRHEQMHCSQEGCKHFLSLDECISNKVVYCGLRRVKTTSYRKWFPALRPSVIRGPVLSDYLLQKIQQFSSEVCYQELPEWLRSAAKLLTGGPEGRDWTQLAKSLGYKKNKIERFDTDMSPGMALIIDWILSSGNTALSIDMITRSLEQMRCDHIIEVIQKGQENEDAASKCDVFISYQWDSQPEATQLRRRLEGAGYSCWMDIGQMGGGDQLYKRIDDGIRNALVVIACVTPKYVASQLCNRELSLADLLRKPIVPVLLEPVSWPPRGGMALLFSQLVYINLRGVGGHGGSGIHADLEDKYNEIIQRVSCYATPLPPPSSPFLAPSRPLYKSTESVHSASAPASSSNAFDASYISGYSPQQPSPVDPTPVAPPVVTADTAGVSAHELPLTQQVHVTKCAVCLIL